MLHFQLPNEVKRQLINFIDRGTDLKNYFRSRELHACPVNQQTMSHVWNVKAFNLLEESH